MDASGKDGTNSVENLEGEIRGDCKETGTTTVRPISTDKAFTISASNLFQLKRYKNVGDC